MKTLEEYLDIWYKEQSKGRSMTRTALNKIIGLLISERTAASKNLNGYGDNREQQV